VHLLVPSSPSLVHPQGVSCALPVCLLRTQRTAGCTHSIISGLQVKAMDSMRETMKLVPAPLGTDAFVHSPEFLNIEQYKKIGREALMNIGLGFAMIAVVVLLLVANPVAATLTFVAVASAIVQLVGFMYFRGTYIDSVTVIFLVISLGLAVDYFVHIAHGYLSTREPDPVLRLERTMTVRPSPSCSSVRHLAPATAVRRRQRPLRPLACC
jgi:Patched family